MTKCLAARHNLLVDVDSKVRICCNNLESLQYDNNDIGQSLFGDKIIEIRQDLDAGIRHDSCHNCWYEEDHIGHSYRQSYNDLYSNYFDLDEPVLKTLHMQSENTCNLTCVYCGPKYSSKWAELVKEKIIHRGINTVSDETLTNLDMITFAGGEPSLIRTNIDILQRLSKLNPQCQIIVNTNLTFYDNNFFDLAKNFQNLTLLVSFESLGQRYEYIRHLAKWNSFKHNFIKACNELPKVNASMIFFPLSAGTMHQTLDFTLDHLDQTDIFLNTYHGNWFDWKSVGSKNIAMIKSKLLHYAESSEEHLQNQLIYHCEAMQSDNDMTILPWLDQFDKFNKLDHKIIFPELYE
jgi:organic radical activating enzyme